VGVCECDNRFEPPRWPDSLAAMSPVSSSSVLLTSYSDAIVVNKPTHFI
jgi:hypothetical protein